MSSDEQKINEVQHCLDGNLVPLSEYSYGDHLTLDEFVEYCRDRFFVDEDGSGYYATTTMISRIEARPSEIHDGNIDRSWTHVVWFNK